jgi:peptidoglycan/LPS O-acetylase OafA/YrhL
MTHIWAVWLFGNYIGKMKPAPVTMYLAAAAVFAGSIILGYVVLRFYDEPVRAWLAKAGTDSKKRRGVSVETLATAKRG